MRLSIRVLGLDLLDVELSTDQDDEDDKARDLSGGSLSATPMGFTPHMERPHELETPDRDW